MEVLPYAVYQDEDGYGRSDMNAIETVGLVKSFRRKRVIQGLDLHVGCGEIYGLVGKNGSGKSTTMKLIAGHMAPDAGEVFVLGERLAPCEAHPRMGSLIESPGLYLELSAFDNLMVKALVLGLVKPRAACERLLAAAGLADAGQQKAKRLSMGMRQRLGVALALLGEPDVLMLDEPLNGLDPEAARDIRTLIVHMNRERGMTVLISSHVLDQLERMCTAYGVIRDGRMVAELTAEEVERACERCLTLRCAEAPRALAALTERLPGARLVALPGDTIRIEGPVEADEVGRALMAEGIAVSELHRTAGDREAFFVDLMGGGDEGERA